jgi:hypothetical protein
MARLLARALVAYLTTRPRMRLKTALFTALPLALIVGCASPGRVTSFTDQPIDAARVVALDAPSAPWVMDIQRQLHEHGFEVLRWSSRSSVTEATGEAQARHYNQAEARHVLVVRGHAPLDAGRRCFGGGYRFDHLNAELIDTQTNRTLLNISGSGYSEGCAPANGTLFGDIARALDGAWTPRHN